MAENAENAEIKQERRLISPLLFLFQMGSTSLVRMSGEVLREQVLAVVVAIRRAHHSVYVVPCRCSRSIFIQSPDGILVVELDQNDGAVDAIVEHRIIAD